MRAAWPCYLAAMEVDFVAYEPLVWSAWGREHHDTVAALRQLTPQAARRRGALSSAFFLRQPRAHIGASLGHRPAVMPQVCLIL